VCSYLWQNVVHSMVCKLWMIKNNLLSHYCFVNYIASFSWSCDNPSHGVTRTYQPRKAAYSTELRHYWSLYCGSHRLNRQSFRSQKLETWNALMLSTTESLFNRLEICISSTFCNENASTAPLTTTASIFHVFFSVKWLQFLWTTKMDH